jgi:hypothetical protein
LPVSFGGGGFLIGGGGATRVKSRFVKEGVYVSGDLEEICEVGGIERVAMVF